MADRLLVVAIDFGTTFSGYAFQYRHTAKRDPLDIRTMKWRNPGYMTYKTPTCILIRKNDDDKLERIAFGYDAEDRMKKCNESNAYYFFRHFKMRLYHDRASKDLILKDHEGKELKALDVFALSIEFLKNHCWTEIQIANNVIETEDVTWVLTVPAIWSERSKKFMREAAIKGGIPPQQLQICLEPEAASLYCRLLPVESRKDKTKVEVKKMETGTKFLTIDAGGGTVDVTFHTMTQSGNLEEISSASGGDWGGSYVNEEFFKCVKMIFGATVMRKITTKEWIRFKRDFENAKIVAQHTGDLQDWINIRLPLTLIEEFEDNEDDIKQTIIDSEYSGKAQVNQDDLQIRANVLMDMFDKILNKITRHVDNIRRKSKLRPIDVDFIFLVGGFSESKWLQETIRRYYPRSKVIIPDNPQLAIMKGAVIAARDPKVIRTRISRLTYGVGVSVPYCKRDHSGQPVTVIEGIKYCQTIFDPLFYKDDKLVSGKQTMTKIQYPLRRQQTELEFKIYTTKSKKAKFTNEEGVQYLGAVVVEGIQTGSLANRDAEMAIIPGNSELEAVAWKLNDREHKFSTKLDFLSY